MKPNVVLILVDQMRGDCLGIKGHPVVETPNLDMMAKHGAIFNSAYSAVPSCIAARAAILTGLTQKSHGRVGYQDGVTWNYKHTIAEEFSQAGYHTQCVGKMHVYPQRNLCGFHNVCLHDGYLHHNRNSEICNGEHFNQCDDYIPWLKEKLDFSADLLDMGLECNSWVARPWMYPEHLHPTNWVVTQSIDFLRRKDPTRPFFLTMSFVRPHSPLDPPKAYYDQYINEDIPDSPIGQWADKEDLECSALDINCIKGILNKKALKRAKTAYYASITHIDHQIGRFIQVLAEYKCLSNTIILFASDHGDLLGDHNLFRKALPYEGSTAIPFIVYDPGNLLNSKQGQFIDDVVELRDIMPSLLDFADIPIPEVVEGKSVKPLLYGNKEKWREYIHGEHSYGKLSNHYVTNGKEKYIWFSQNGSEQYFDLETDPHELIDLSQDEHYCERVNYWRDILIKELEGREEGYSDGIQLFVGKQAKGSLEHIL